MQTKEKIMFNFNPTKDKKKKHSQESDSLGETVRDIADNVSSMFSSSDTSSSSSCDSSSDCGSSSGGDCGSGGGD